MALAPVSTRLLKTLIKQAGSKLPMLKQTHASHLHNMFTNSAANINKQSIQMNTTEIVTTKDIPMSAMTLYPQVMSHVKRQSTHSLCATYNQITIHFITERKPSMNIYREYVYRMLIWLHIAYAVSQKKCAQQLTIYIYHTSLCKELPSNTNHVLTPWNVNTAFTQTCMPSAEIVIYRKEEWFKVFIHETFHALGLDFSGMNERSSTSRINRLFHLSVNNLRLYEAYTECWARIINAAFASWMLHKHHVHKFTSLLKLYLHAEQLFAIQQTNKVLLFATNKRYDEFLSSTSYEYREQTSVISYYVVTMALLCNVNSFLDWCQMHNPGWFHFHQNVQIVSSFCNLIEESAVSTCLANKHPVNNNDKSNTLRFTAVELN